MAESTRKEGPIYTNTPIEEKTKDVKPPERRSKQKPNPQYSKPIETPRKKLTFQEEDEDAKEIQKEIEEVKRARRLCLLKGKRLKKKDLNLEATTRGYKGKISSYETAKKKIRGIHSTNEQRNGSRFPNVL